MRQIWPGLTGVNFVQIWGAPAVLRMGPFRWQRTSLKASCQPENEAKPSCCLALSNRETSSKYVPGPGAVGIRSDYLKDALDHGEDDVVVVVDLQLL